MVPLPHHSGTPPQSPKDSTPYVTMTGRRMRRMKGRRRKPSANCSATGSKGRSVEVFFWFPSSLLLPQSCLSSSRSLTLSSLCLQGLQTASPEVHPRYNAIISQGCQANLLWPVVRNKGLQRAPALPKTQLLTAYMLQTINKTFITNSLTLKLMRINFLDLGSFFPHFYLHQ